MPLYNSSSDTIQEFMYLPRLKMVILGADVWELRIGGRISYDAWDIPFLLFSRTFLKQVHGCQTVQIRRSLRSLNPWLNVLRSQRKSHFFDSFLNMKITTGFLIYRCFSWWWMQSSNLFKVDPICYESHNLHKLRRFITILRSFLNVCVLYIMNSQAH